MKYKNNTSSNVGTNSRCKITSRTVFSNLIYTIHNTSYRKKKLHTFIFLLPGWDGT